MAAKRSNRGPQFTLFGTIWWTLVLLVVTIGSTVVAGHWRVPLQFRSPLDYPFDGAAFPEAAAASPLAAATAPRPDGPALAAPGSAGAPAAGVAQPSSGAAAPEQTVADSDPVPARQFCDSCCNDGEKYVKCFDLGSCEEHVTRRRRGSAPEKYALVLSHFGMPNARFKFLPFISSWRDQATKYPGVHIDILLLITAKDAKYLKPENHKLMEDTGVRVVEVDWNVPPGMMYKGQSAFNHYRDDGSDWCGPQDLMRLHAFTLEGYDAVAYYDSDIEFRGDLLPVFRCASKPGRFITTGGGIGVPLNIGFFALRPDPRFMQASRFFAENYNYSLANGWGNSGWAPSKVKYAGGECGQGFIHTLLYKRGSEPSLKSLEAAGLAAPGMLDPVQIDKCVWNYQTSFQCPKDFDCSLVRAHHKPKKPGKNPNECLKLGVKWKPPKPGE
ncbi:unnamed protein product [Prorocentrum cordatum]|uniref:Nucleotide-diphospho-sugar transferase domain-containing protein n=1 Tax=Prorocentrum cordatum TaxID=2364126 RepID=A0ABN9XLL7_9DINO|nr:unnamed protein product [Polarella glacialis]